MGTMNRGFPPLWVPLRSKFLLLCDLCSSVAKLFSPLSSFMTFVRFVVYSSSYFKISCSSFCTGSGSRNPIT